MWNPGTTARRWCGNRFQSSAQRTFSLKCEKRKCRLTDLPEEVFAKSGAAGVRAKLGVANAVAAFKSTGSGWQTRLNDALRDWLRTHA